MHWTLQIFCLLTAFTFAGAIVQWALVRSVPIGAWICGAWALQQVYWLANAEDSVALFLMCDAIIFSVTWALRGRWQARWIFGLTMLSIAGWVHGGTFGWWWSTYCVMASMLLGMPFVERAIWREPKRRTDYEVA